LENKNQNNDYTNLVTQLAKQILNGSNINNSNINSPISQSNINIVQTSNLINELIQLEQQNRIQIELIQRIIQNKYQDINYVNKFLDNFLTQYSLENNNQGEFTTKSSSNEIEKQVEEIPKPIDKQIEDKPFLDLDDDDREKSKFFLILYFIFNYWNFLFFDF